MRQLIRVLIALLGAVGISIIENSLASASYSLDEAEAVWEISYAECNEKVQDLSVQESFSYYESGIEPP